MTTQTPEQPSLAERRVAFGRRLIAAREAQEITRNALAQTTRITIAFVTALETGAFEKLPGDVFARGFIRNLCKALRIDPTDLLAEFAACSDTPPEKPILAVEVKSRPKASRFDDWRGLARQAARSLPAKQWRRATRMGVGIALTGLAIYAVSATRLVERVPQWLSQGLATATLPTKAILPVESPAPSKTTTRATTPSAPTESSPAPEPVVAAESVPAPAPVTVPTAPGQTIELVVTETVRIRVELDNGESVTKEYKPDTYNLTFESAAELLIFDANAVKVRYNGRSLGSLGVKGRVRRLSFDAGLPRPENNL